MTGSSIELQSSPQIRISSVSFRYGRKSAPLRDFSWEVPEGRTLLLGPNGAGKSTLLRIMAGLLKPSSGRIAYCRPAKSPEPLRSQNVGLLPQNSPCVRGLTVQEQVEYAAWLGGAPSGKTKAAIDAIEVVNLGHKLKRPTRSLSGGEARRLNLACALTTSPDILLLDEPTTGLDPIERENLTEIIRSRVTSKIIISATHEADLLFDAHNEVSILVNGRIADSFPTVGHEDEWLSRYRQVVKQERAQ